VTYTGAMRCQWCGTSMQIGLSPFDGLLLCNACWEAVDRLDAETEEAFRRAGIYPGDRRGRKRRRAGVFEEEP
jgi:hypothetical protein